jgi:hypothetical protein
MRFSRGKHRLGTIAKGALHQPGGYAGLMRRVTGGQLPVTRICITSLISDAV